MSAIHGKQYCTSLTPKLSFYKVKYKYVLRVTDATGVSTVHVVNIKDSLERMEKMIEMGFREGFIMILNALGEMLEAAYWT